MSRYIILYGTFSRPRLPPLSLETARGDKGPLYGATAPRFWAAVQYIYLHFHYWFVLVFLLVVLCSYRSGRIYRVPTSRPRFSRLGQWVKTLGFCITKGYVYMIEDCLRMLFNVIIGTGLVWAYLVIAWHEHNQHGFIPID